MPSAAATPAPQTARKNAIAAASPVASGTIARRTAPRTAFHDDADDEIAQSTVLRHRAGRTDASTLRRRPLPAASPSQHAVVQTVARRPKRAASRDDGAFASPIPRVPAHRAEPAPVPPTAPVDTPAGQPAHPHAVWTDHGAPLTATQEAVLEDGYRAPSPPPLFTLQSVSMPGTSLERDEPTQRAEFDETAAAPAAHDGGRPVRRHRGASAGATPSSSKLQSLADEKQQAQLWASSTKAFFDRIDSMPLRTA